MSSFLNPGGPGGGGPSGSGGVSYFVDGVAGNDSNNGLSPASAFKTITKANTLSLLPGMSMLFKGGQIFSGALVALIGGSLLLANPAAPVTYGSYGGGQATISSGNSNGFTSTNQAGIIVRDLTFTGAASTNRGILFQNTLSSGVHLQNIQAINCNVSGYGLNGVDVEGGTNGSGYDDILIGACTVSNCCSVANSGLGTAGIMVHSPSSYGLAVNPVSLINAVIRDCVSHDNVGATDSNFTGCGICLTQTNIGRIDRCLAYNNGGSAISTSGPVGIIIGDCSLVTIRDSISRNNLSGSTADGDGFDVDGGSINCTVVNCLAKNNFGAGFLAASYHDGMITASDKCSFINCVSENDGGGTNAAANASFEIFNSTSGVLTNLAVYGCKLFQTNSSANAVNIGGAAAATVTGTFNENTFSISGSQKFISTTANPTGLVFNANGYNSNGLFSVVWNGTNYSALFNWFTATGQETNGQAEITATRNFTVNGQFAAVTFNDTETHGDQFYVGAAVNGTQPYFALGDNTIRSGLGATLWASNFDGKYSFQVPAGAVFGWSSGANFADGAAMDTGISRTGAAAAALGNGTPGDFSGSLELTSLSLAGITELSSPSAGSFEIKIGGSDLFDYNVTNASAWTYGGTAAFFPTLYMSTLQVNYGTAVISAPAANEFEIAVGTGEADYGITAGSTWTFSGTVNAKTGFAVNGTPGISATITTAKITPVSGANGSMTFVNGILTAQTQAT